MMNGQLPRRGASLPARFLDGEQARSRFGDKLDRLGSSLLRSDPLADAVVASFAEFAPGAGFRLLERALATGIRSVPEAPEPVRALLAQIDQVPAWVDWRAVDRGGAVLLRSGVVGGFVLALKSLVLGYASPGGNKPLMMSGRLQEQSVRRLGETSRFVYAVSRASGMRRYADGFGITVKVRVMHAQVRRLIWRSDQWRHDLWGEPLNQHDMVATIILFSFAMLDGLETMGYRVSPEAAEDVIHLWRYVGHVIGVEEDLLPASVAEARELAAMIQATQGPPDDDARALVRALLGAGVRGARTEGQRRLAERQADFAHGFCRVLLGDELADQLAVPKTLWRHMGPAVRPFASLAARAHRLPIVGDLAIGSGDQYWRASIAMGLGSRPATFAPPARIGTTGAAP